MIKKEVCLRKICCLLSIVIVISMVTIPISTYCEGYVREDNCVTTQLIKNDTKNMTVTFSLNNAGKENVYLFKKFISHSVILYYSFESKELMQPYSFENDIAVESGKTVFLTVKYYDMKFYCENCCRLPLGFLENGQMIMFPVVSKVMNGVKQYGPTGAFDCCDRATIKLNKKKYTMKAKKTYKLKATTDPKDNVKITWKSSKPKIVRVDSKGKIKAIKPGKARITASILSGTKKKSCVVTVKKVKKKKK